MRLHAIALSSAGGAGLGAFFLAGDARALDSEVTSDTAAQFYDVRSPTGEVVLSRRRVTTTLGVGAYNLIDAPPDDPTAPELLFRARLRYDADYGASPDEAAAPTQLFSSSSPNYQTAVPGFYQDAVDLMYGYVEGRRFLHGWLGFKLGRQYVTDALGWWSFDGGEVRITTPFYVAGEVYGGLEQRGGMPFSTPRYQRDGVWTGDRSGYDPLAYPAYQPSDIAPAYGVAVESTGFNWIHGRLSYRRVYNTGSSNVSEFASGIATPTLYDGTRISSERLGYAMDATWADVGGAKGGIVYDLYNAGVTQMYASLDKYFGQKVTVSLDYDFYKPTFDADSIWNFFAGEPMNNLGLRAFVQATDKIDFSVSGYTRIYTVQTSEYSLQASPNLTTTYNPSYFPTSSLAFDEGGTLAGRYKWGEGVVGVRGSGNFGDGGNRVGGDVYGQRTIETRYVVDARASVYEWKDDLRPDRDATSFSYVLGAGYKFSDRSRTLIEWEHDINRLAGQRFRVMAWLNVAVLP